MSSCFGTSISIARLDELFDQFPWLWPQYFRETPKWMTSGLSWHCWSTLVWHRPSGTYRRISWNKRLSRNGKRPRSALLASWEGFTILALTSVVKLSIVVASTIRSSKESSRGKKVAKLSRNFVRL
jgi:hypothetical protein